MCVIALIEDKRPSTEMVEKMWNKNPDGGGLAWRKDGYVHWKKGLKLSEMQGMIKSLPTPFIAHFRIASVGGVKDELCHPFPISEKVELDLSGKTKGGVLFHNGHWGDWKKELVSMHVKLPRNPWSDSRAMALMTYYSGFGFLDVLDEKVICFYPDGIEIFNGWWKQMGPDKIWCSNDFFETQTGGRVYGSFHDGTYEFQRMCKFGNCTRRDNLDTRGYCPTHSPEEKKVESATNGGSTSTNIKPVAINGKPVDKDGNVIDGVGVAERARVLLDACTTEPGGAPSVDPFAHLQSLYSEGRITKGELKRQKKQVRKMIRKQTKALEKGQKDLARRLAKDRELEDGRLQGAELRILERMMSETPPVVVKH